MWGGRPNRDRVPACLCPADSFGTRRRYSTNGPCVAHGHGRRCSARAVPDVVVIPATPRRMLPHLVRCCFQSRAMALVRRSRAEERGDILRPLAAFFLTLQDIVTTQTALGRAQA